MQNLAHFRCMNERAQQVRDCVVRLMIGYPCKYRRTSCATSAVMPFTRSMMYIARVKTVNDTLNAMPVSSFCACAHTP